MKMRQLAGRSASVIALGSTDFGGVRAEAQSREILDRYAELGGNVLDTARVYGKIAEDIPGDSEKVIGRWLKDRPDREKFVISTKGGHPPVRNMSRSRLDRANLTDDVQRSLEALSVVRIDLYWLHRDDVTRPVGDIVETLNGFYENGWIEIAGVSNWDPARIREANAYAAAHGLRGIGGNQLQYSLAVQESPSDPTCRSMTAEAWRMHRDEGLLCFAYSSQAKAIFTVLAEKGEEALSKKARERFLTPENRAIFDRIQKLGRETGLSAGSIALAYLTCQPFRTVPIVGASRPEQLNGLAEAGDAILTPEQVRYLRNME